jgi:hypothetical protein
MQMDFRLSIINLKTMKTLVLLITVVLFFSCKNKVANKDGFKNDSEKMVENEDTSTLLQNRKEKKVNASHDYIKGGAKDTTITFSIEGLSAEGSEVKAHYINDSLKEATWNIYGETGQSTIKYYFLNNNRVKAEETNYNYQQQLTEVRSKKDMILKNRLTYLLDTNGTLLSIIKQKDFVNVFPDFKQNVPFVLMK